MAAVRDSVPSLLKLRLPAMSITKAQRSFVALSQVGARTRPGGPPAGSSTALQKALNCSRTSPIRSGFELAGWLVAAAATRGSIALIPDKNAIHNAIGSHWTWFICPSPCHSAPTCQPAHPHESNANFAVVQCNPTSLFSEYDTCSRASSALGGHPICALSVSGVRAPLHTPGWPPHKVLPYSCFSR